MENLADKEGSSHLCDSRLDLAAYKAMIAKAILYKKTQALVRPMFPAFQGNVTTYLVSLVAHKLGERIDLERIWAQQDISKPLQSLLLQTWAEEVNSVLHQSAAGRMISEWAKKPECWVGVRGATIPRSPLEYLKWSGAQLTLT